MFRSALITLGAQSAVVHLGPMFMQLLSADSSIMTQEVKEGVYKESTMRCFRLCTDCFDDYDDYDYYQELARKKRDDFDYYNEESNNCSKIIINMK